MDAKSLFLFAEKRSSPTEQKDEWRCDAARAAPIRQRGALMVMTTAAMMQVFQNNPGENQPPPSPAGLVVLMKRQKLGDKENRGGLLRRDGGQTDRIKA